jgi:hypothetical protein
MPRVGEAFVEIEGDYRELADNGAREIEQSLNRAAANLDLSELDKAFSDAGKQAGETFTRDVNGRLRNSKGHYVKTGETVGRALGQGVRRGIDSETRREQDGNFLTRIFGKLDDKFGGAADAFSGKLSKLFDPQKLLKGGALGLVDLLSKTLTFGGIAGILYQATSALLSFSGVLATVPGLLGAAAVAGGTLAIAFSGIGGAIEAVASGDMEKINEALKDLSPAARSFVLEFRGIIPVFKEIRKQVQQNFFEQFEGELSRVVSRLGGVIGGGLSTIATDLGVQFGVILNRLQSPGAQRFFDRLLESGSNLVRNVGPPLIRLLDAFAGAFEKTLPFVDRIFEGLGFGLDKFAAFIDEKVADGSFERFLTKAFETAGLLGDAIGEVTRLLQAMFADSNETGNEFLETFTNAIATLADYFESKPGKEALETLVFLGKAVAAVIYTIVAGTLFWLTAVNRVWQAAKNVYQTLRAALGLYNELRNAGSAVANAFRVGAGAFPGFAVGGIVTKPTVAQIGEAGPEAIVPLTNAKRAREVMEEAGLVSIAAGMGSSAGTTVIVYLGTEQITDILDTRVEKGLQTAARSIARGDRQD